MEVLVSLIIIVFGVLQIILFFKLWGMTNDVRKLTEHFCSHSTNIGVESEKTIPPLVGYDERLDTIKKGDYVLRASDGKKMLVSNIENDKFICSVNVLSGAQYYGKNEVKYIEKP